MGGWFSSTTPGKQLTDWGISYRAQMQCPGAKPVDEGYSYNNVLASYVHLHFGSAPEFADSLVAACRCVAVGGLDSAAQAAAEAARMGRPALYPVMSAPNLSAAFLQGRALRSRSADGSEKSDTSQEADHFRQYRSMDISGLVYNTERSLSSDVLSTYGHPAVKSLQHTERYDEQAVADKISCQPASPSTTLARTLSVDHLYTSPSSRSPPPESLSPCYRTPCHTPPSEDQLYGTSISPQIFEPHFALANPAGTPDRDGTQSATTSGRDSQHARLRRGLHMSNDKIVSLLPSGTEILFAIGVGSRVVGVTDLCDYPKEAQLLPVVCRCGFARLHAHHCHQH